MKAKPAPSGIRSKRFMRFPEIIHGMVIGPRIPVDTAQGPEQPALAYARKVAEELGMRDPFAVLNRLAHTNRVHTVDAAVSRPTRGDGLVTTKPGTALCMTVADCLPVFMYDPVRHVIGIAHAGRPGIVRGIVPALMRSMKRSGALPSRIVVWIGPSAHPCCYSFDVRTHRAYYRPFLERYHGSCASQRNGRMHLDLVNAVRHDLMRCGVRKRNIETDPTCTVHSGKMLPSNVRQRTLREHALWACIAMRRMTDDLKGKKVLVLGLGLHGGGADMVRWLVHEKAHVVVTDLKTKSQLRDTLKALRSLPVRYVLGHHRFEDVDHAQLIIANPGVSRESKFLMHAQRHSIPIENDASLFFERCPAPIIGITGTKGKTTTTTLIMRMLVGDRRNVVGVGYHEVPLMNALNRITPASTVVAELSSWRLERLAQHRQSPHIAVCTNVMPDHLDRYHGFTDYAKAKRIIFDYQKPTDSAILNRDNAVTRRFGASIRGSRWWFSLKPFTEENGIFVRTGKIVMRSFGKETVVATVPDTVIRAPHQLSNILAAALAARLSGASLRSIRHAIQHLPEIPHRLEQVRRLNGIRYINDSAATTPDAALAALKSISGPIVLITGGTDKKLHFRTYARYIRSHCKALVFLDGTATATIVRLQPTLSRVPVTRTMRNAVQQARHLASRGDTVLLSPGAASFELFKHEFDRGDQFRAAVKSLRA